MKHKWHIDEREYQRHEQRRGTRHAFRTLDPQTTCLVVVDMVPFFVDVNEYARGVVPAIAALAAELRSAGGTVAWIVPGNQPMPAARREFFGDEIAERYRQSGGGGSPLQRVGQDFDVDNDRTKADLKDDQQFLADVARDTSFKQFKQACDYWLIMLDPDGEEPIDQLETSGVSTTVGSGSRTKIMADADAVSGSAFTKMIEHEANKIRKQDLVDGIQRTTRRPKQTDGTDDDDPDDNQ